MAATSGKLGQVWLESDGSAAAEADLISLVTSWELDLQCETVDITGMSDSGAKKFLAGLTASTGSIKFFASGALGDVEAGATVKVALLYADNDAAYWTGTAIITSVKPTVAVDGAVTLDCALQFSGGASYA